MCIYIIICLQISMWMCDVCHCAYMWVMRMMHCAFCIVQLYIVHCAMCTVQCAPDRFCAMRGCGELQGSRLTFLDNWNGFPNVRRLSISQFTIFHFAFQFTIFHFEFQFTILHFENFTFLTFTISQSSIHINETCQRSFTILNNSLLTEQQFAFDKGMKRRVWR